MQHAALIEKLITEDTTHQIASLTRSIRDAAERQAAATKALHDATVEFIQTGLADLRQQRPHPNVKIHGIGWGHLGFRWDRFFKELARELKRPLVFVRSSYCYPNGRYQCGVRGRFKPQISVQRRKYTAPLVSHLLLIDNKEVLLPLHDTIAWQFIFQDEALFNDWRHRCAEDPGFRKALRLT